MQLIDGILAKLTPNTVTSVCQQLQELATDMTSRCCIMVRMFGFAGAQPTLVATLADLCHSLFKVIRSSPPSKQIITATADCSVPSFCQAQE